uniref:DUF659 domain-containing protein n=1 Tax=Meloidogyne hapla TaxID=6305 RepID=A0A1I8B4L1_MELHA
MREWTSENGLANFQRAFLRVMETLFIAIHVTSGKYCKRQIPDESTLRKKYLDICFRRTIDRIKKKIGDGFVWVGVDETTDRAGRYAANLLVGRLDSGAFYPPHLISTKNAISSAEGTVGMEIKKKMDAVLAGNPGLSKLIDIAKILTGGEVEIDMDPNMISAFKYAPMTSTDMERSFSIYRTVLAENRMRFTPENLERFLICNCEMRN